ncbi:hypothetical protein [Streptomyces sp. NPDC053048]|uniref:hypothetical protein n=1 Tax=Streptomyces sp. NPDC053048 TaxID=3365694 RepID=UPI0037D4D19F
MMRYDAETERIVKQDKAVREAGEFSERNGFQSYRCGDLKRTVADARAAAGQGAYDGARVEFNDATGRMTIHPTDDRPVIVYEGRKSP